VNTKSIVPVVATFLPQVPGLKIDNKRKKPLFQRNLFLMFSGVLTSARLSDDVLTLDRYVGSSQRTKTERPFPK